MRLNRENAYKLNERTQVEELAELSQEDSIALIEICSQYLDEQKLESLKTNLERHIGEGATYTHRKDLKQNLKIIYSQMLEKKELCASITNKIHERTLQCTEGFHSDSRQLVIDLCYSPRDIHDFLTRIRQDIVTRTANGLSDNVHDINRVSLLASTSYGTHQTNIHDYHQYIDDEEILNQLAINFEKKYERPFFVLFELNEQFKNYIQSFLNYESGKVNPHETQTLVDQFIQLIFINHPNVIRIKQAHLQYETYKTQQQHYLNQIQSVLNRHDFLFQQNSFLQYLLEPEHGALHQILIRKSKDLSPEMLLEIEEIKLKWRSFRSSIDISSMIAEKNEAQEAYQQCFWNLEQGELSYLEIKKAFFLELFAQNIFEASPIDFAILQALHNHFSVENIVNFMHDFGLKQEDFPYLIQYFPVQSIHIDQFLTTMELYSYEDVMRVVGWFELAKLNTSISFVTDLRVLNILKLPQFLSKSTNLFLKISAHCDFQELIIELEKYIHNKEDLFELRFLTDNILQHFAKIFLQRENTFNIFHQLTPFLSKEFLQEQILFYFHHQEYIVQKKFHPLWLREMEFILKNINQDKLKLIFSKKKIIKDYLEFFERAERLERLCQLNVQLDLSLLDHEEKLCYFVKILSREDAFKLISNITHPSFNVDNILLLLNYMPVKRKVECLEIFLPNLKKCFLTSSVSKFFEQICPRDVSEYEIRHFANMHLKPHFQQYVQQSILNLPWILKQLNVMEVMEFIFSDVIAQLIPEIKQPSNLLNILPQIHSPNLDALYFLFSKYDICEIFDRENLVPLINSFSNIFDLPTFLIRKDFGLSLKNINTFLGFIPQISADKKIPAIMYFLFKNNSIIDFAQDLNAITQLIDNQQLSLFYKNLTMHLYHNHHFFLLPDIIRNISLEEYEMVSDYFVPFIPYLFDNIDAYRTFLGLLDAPKRKHFIQHGLSMIENSQDLLDIISLLPIQNYSLLINGLNSKLVTMFSNFSDWYLLIKQLSPNSESQEQSSRECFVRQAIPYFKEYISLPSDIKKLKQLSGSQMSILALKELQLSYPDIDDYMRYFQSERGMKIEYLYLKLYTLTLQDGIKFFSQPPHVIAAAQAVLKCLRYDNDANPQELTDIIRILPGDISDIFNSDEVSMYLFISQTNTFHSLN